MLLFFLKKEKEKEKQVINLYQKNKRDSEHTFSTKCVFRAQSHLMLIKEKLKRSKMSFYDY